jgi:endonuclease/exonuclease/phosphatase family metal-dependent hydrolase
MDLTNHVFEKRGLLAAEVQHSAISDPVILLTVHLDLTHGGRIRQTRKIKSYLSREFSMTSPLILAGDFNDWNGKLSPVFLTELNFREAFMDHSGTHALSFPSQMPFLPLDRVYYRGFHVREAQVLRGAPWSKLSDHLPLYVELEFAGHSASDEVGASSAG